MDNMYSKYHTVIGYRLCNRSFFPHHLRVSVSYSEAGMNVLADIWLVSHTFALASATRALEQAKTQCRPSSGEVEAGGHGS